jgi:cellulose synthase/poly-beta-1,6-N-acetylglucosamine synthase-like glycosyltransferase
MSLVMFWGAMATIVYTYLLYPIIILLRGILWVRPYKTADITPRVSLIIAAYNESEGIGAKIENILSLDYPAEQLEVMIASDGSNDGTDAIVRSYERANIRLLSLPRQGKAPALNAAVAASSGEILVFSDANSMYAPNAIRELVRPFAAPEVGGVAGNQVYLKKKGDAGLTSAGEQSYWDFDRQLKQFQSKSGNVISATGAIYAIRRSLFHPVMGGVTDDFTISTDVIVQGERLVFAPDAIAYEPVAGAGGVEFGRKVRVITRGLRAVVVRRTLLNPFRYGFYSLQLFSHKVLRRLVVFPLLLLLVTSPFLWSKGLFYQLVTLGQALFYGFAALGWLMDKTGSRRLKIFTIPFYFCMVNYASLLAALNVVRGNRIERWEPQRHTNAKPVARDAA